MTFQPIRTCEWNRHIHPHCALLVILPCSNTTLLEFTSPVTSPHIPRNKKKPTFCCCRVRLTLLYTYSRTVFTKSISLVFSPPSRCYTRSPRRTFTVLRENPLSFFFLFFFSSLLHPLSFQFTVQRSVYISGASSRTSQPGGSLSMQAVMLSLFFLFFSLSIYGAQQTSMLCSLFLNWKPDILADQKCVITIFSYFMCPVRGLLGTCNQYCPRHNMIGMGFFKMCFIAVALLASATGVASTPTASPTASPTATPTAAADQNAAATPTATPTAAPTATPTATPPTSTTTTTITARRRRSSRIRLHLDVTTSWRRAEALLI